MRCALFSAILVAGFAFAPTTASAQQKKGACPKNATVASLAIWPRGTISTGKLASGRHPCGRSMECVGGQNISNTGGRNCRWL
jgi:hypothetical protein